LLEKFSDQKILIVKIWWRWRNEESIRKWMSL